MYDHRHYYSPHRLHIKTIRQLVCTSRKQACVHVLWEKEKAYKNVKRKNISTTHSTTLSNSTLFFCLFDLFYTPSRNYPLFWWMVFICPHLQAQSRRTPFRNAIFLSRANRLSKRYFFCPFHSVLVCFDFLQCQQHYFLTVIAVYTVDREASWRLNRFLVRSPTGSQK